MCLIDQSLVRFSRHPGPATCGIQAELRPIDLHVRQALNLRDGLLGRTWVQDGAGNEESRASQSRIRRLLVTDLDALLFIITQADDGGHAVTRIELELSNYVLAGV